MGRIYLVAMLMFGLSVSCAKSEKGSEASAQQQVVLQPVAATAPVAFFQMPKNAEPAAGCEVFKEPRKLVKVTYDTAKESRVMRENEFHISSNEEGVGGSDLSHLQVYGFTVNFGTAESFLVVVPVEKGSDPYFAVESAALRFLETAQLNANVVVGCKPSTDYSRKAERPRSVFHLESYTGENPVWFEEGRKSDFAGRITISAVLPN